MNFKHLSIISVFYNFAPSKINNQQFSNPYGSPSVAAGGTLKNTLLDVAAGAFQHPATRSQGALFSHFAPSFQPAPFLVGGG